MIKTGYLFVLFILIVGGVLLGITGVQKFYATKDIQGVVSFPHKNNVGTQNVIQNVIENPFSLSIPAIGVDAAIEHVGLDKQGRMDVPQNADNVAWYNLGFKPGERGNAVLAGHLDKVTGEPAVFWNIPKLKKGDEILVEDNKGKSLRYVVVRTEQYPYNNFPLQEVFGSSDASMLNLITCVGTWNVSEASYSHRYVVYSQKVDE